MIPSPTDAGAPGGASPSGDPPSRNFRRRQKYKQDADYRTAVVTKNKASRAKSREERDKALAAEKAASCDDSNEPSYRLVPVEVRDPATKEIRVVRMFTISALSAVTGASLQGIRLWERRKEILGPTMVSPRGDRLYSVERLEEIAAQLAAQKRVRRNVSEPRRDKPLAVDRTVRLPDGTSQVIRFFRVGALARVLGRIIATVEHLESRGILPETPFRASSRLYRLYTLPMIEAAEKALQKVGGVLRTHEAQTEFCARVTEAWSPYAGWSIVEEAEPAGAPATAEVGGV